MWSMLKSMVALVVLGLAGWTVMFVDIGGQPLAGHFSDIWRSDTVQAKVDLMRDGVRQEIEDRLAAAAEQGTRDAVRQGLHSGGDEFDPKDRTALDTLIADPR